MYAVFDVEYKIAILAEKDNHDGITVDAAIAARFSNSPRRMAKNATVPTVHLAASHACPSPQPCTSSLSGTANQKTQRVDARHK
jgi:hypothetical protein